MPSIFDQAVELRHLRYFCAVAEAENFTRAAAAIGLRQPTLSHQIQQLEQALGADLFQRGRRVCRLTAAGEMLLPYARRILGEMEAMRHALNDLSGLRRGALTVATLPVLAERLLPRALAVFHRAHPGIQVRVLEMSVDEMARALSVGTVEVCLGNMDTRGQLVRGQVLYEEELVAVVSHNDARAERASLTVAELVGDPIIAPPAGYGTRTLLLSTWTKARRLPTLALEASSTEVVLQAVSAGGGVGIVPASALWGRRPERWQAVRIQRPVMRRQIGVWQAQLGRRRPAAEALMPFLRQAVTQCAAETSGPEGVVTVVG